MSEIKFVGKLPKGTANGVGPIVRDLVAHPDKTRVIIAIVDCEKITTHPDTGEVVPTLRLRRVEAITGLDDALDARALLERAMGRRTGTEALPFEIQEELNLAFEASASSRP